MDSGPAPTLIYRLHPGVAYEGFDDGALVLRLEDRHLFELNLTAQFVLAHTDGRRTASQIAADIASTFEISQDDSLGDLAVIYNYLASERIVENCSITQTEEQRTIMAASRFARNPDVGLREEDEEGALLFNPDTNQVLVINTSGLYIWRLCDGKHTLDEIVNALLEEFDGATPNDVAVDVREFMDSMTRSGFVGAVVPMDTSGAIWDA